MSGNTVMAIIALGFMLMMSFLIYSVTTSETQQVKACVSSGGEWVDIDERFNVVMGCKR